MLIITFIIFIGCFILERIFTGWQLPKVHSWFSRVVLINVIQLGVVLFAGYSWERWLASASLFDLSEILTPGWAGFVAYFIATFVFYWWHRLRHESDFFWKYFHQIHHSPQRLEVITSFYKHPLEMIVNSVIGSLLIYSVLGLSLEAGAIYTLCTALGEFFYHTNIKTPQWIGYIFQRPEMHRIHHKKEYHKNNYGDFAIWDQIFGTYENPKTWSSTCGFSTPRELRLKDMLLFRDVHKFILIFCFLGLGLSSYEVSAHQEDLSASRKSCQQSESVLSEGDLIFIDVPNFIFRQVARSTKSWTSHVGIAFKNKQGQWVVDESKIPISTQTPLCDFLNRSFENRFEIKRFHRKLTRNEVSIMKATSQSLQGKYYNLGFNLDSKRFFCSKFVLKIYDSVGLPVGKIQTFKQLLASNPSYPISFWRVWFLGSIPWSRRTITPASLLEDPKFATILEN